MTRAMWPGYVGIGASWVGTTSGVFAAIQHALDLPGAPLWASLAAGFDVALIAVTVWLRDVLRGQLASRRDHDAGS